MRTLLRGIALMAALMVGACAPEAGDDNEMAADAEPAAEAAAETTPQLPDTTAEAVWTMLQDADYRSTWALWPDKGELYEGEEPHGMLLTTYLNSLAMDALEGPATTMPEGAVLVKENYMPDSTLAAVTVMVKQSPGYNPEHADWWFLKRLADGTVEVEGRGEGCQNCHGQQAANDYIFTGSLAGG